LFGVKQRKFAPEQGPLQTGINANQGDLYMQNSSGNGTGEAQTELESRCGLTGQKSGSSPSLRMAGILGYD
jgi:hypothetical protein